MYHPMRKYKKAFLFYTFAYDKVHDRLRDWFARERKRQIHRRN